MEINVVKPEQGMEADASPVQPTDADDGPPIVDLELLARRQALDSERMAMAKTADRKEQKVVPILSKRVLPLLHACALGDVSACKVIISELELPERIEIVNEYDEEGQTPLFYCVNGKDTSNAYVKNTTADDVTPKHLECIALLCDYGADPNHQDDKKNTIMHIACALHHVKLMRVMIRYGADTMLENWEYRVCQQQAKTEALRTQCIAQINRELEELREDIQEKRIYHVEREERSYLRSMYDVIDGTHVDVMRFQEITPMLETEDEAL
jgi:hypothetical protein